MSQPNIDPKYGPVHRPRSRAAGIIHLAEQEDGTVKVLALFDPLLDTDPAHVPSEVEIMASKMLRAVGKDIG
jgi:hypothetical protein